MKKKTKIIVAILVAVVVLLSPCVLMALLLGGASWSNNHPKQGENVAKVDWLPEEATNVSYYKTYSFTAYEFKISEEGFKKWASHWNLKRIDKPVAIGRYSFRTAEPPSGDSIEELEAYRAKQDVRIKNGYFFETPPRGNGGGTRVGYDLDTGMAYYQDNPR